MDFSLVYLAWRFLYRILDFFHHWYVDGSRAIGHRFIETLRATDRSFAVKITLEHFFEPLYKDYSLVGRILGIVFRTGRVLVGSIFYLFLTIFFAAIYCVWVLIPALLIAYAARSL